MNKKRLLKSIIGTVVIYGVLYAFLYLLGNMTHIGLGALLWINGVSCAVCSIVAGLLFKGEMYAAVWAAGAMIFFTVAWSWDFEVFMTGLVLYLLPLLIPFFIVKSIFMDIKEDKKAKAGAEQNSNTK